MISNTSGTGWASSGSVSTVVTTCGKVFSGGARSGWVTLAVAVLGRGVGVSGRGIAGVAISTNVVFSGIDVFSGVVASGLTVDFLLAFSRRLNTRLSFGDRFTEAISSALAKAERGESGLVEDWYSLDLSGLIAALSVRAFAFSSNMSRGAAGV